MNNQISTPEEHAALLEILATMAPVAFAGAVGPRLIPVHFEAVRIAMKVNGTDTTAALKIVNQFEGAALAASKKLHGAPEEEE